MMGANIYDFAELLIKEKTIWLCNYKLTFIIIVLGIIDYKIIYFEITFIIIIMIDNIWCMFNKCI